MRGVEQIPWLYDFTMSLGEATGLKRWREWLVRGARGLTLDVGCGTGRNLPLYDSGVRAVGLDPSMDSLKKARQRAPGVPLVRGSAEALPFRDGTFDTVVSGLVFCSVPDPRRGLREVKRVLKQAGTLRMLEHVRSTRRLGAKWQDIIQPAWTWCAGGCHPNRDTESNVRASGFEIEGDTLRSSGVMRRFSARPVATR
ncbi:MAG: class I SAM-dependent methyltransferase [Myxococcaceae bacterium]